MPVNERWVDVVCSVVTADGGAIAGIPTEQSKLAAQLGLGKRFCRWMGLPGSQYADQKRMLDTGGGCLMTDEERRSQEI